jgi:DNA polymerase-3 subunit delta
MQLKPDALPGHLARGPLARTYVLAGDEPLLAIEAADAIRAAARAAGFTEREVLHADARFDWSQLARAGSGLSLFAEKRIVDIRLPGGKPGKEGAAALAAHARSLDRPGGEDSLTLLTLPRLDRRARATDWAMAFEGAGVWIDLYRIERESLPAWIGQRLARQQQRAPREALEFVADRVEGNLLAAHQEIRKLGLLYPARELSLQDVMDAVLNVARYEVFALPQVMLTGDAARVLRTLDGLRGEGEALPLVVWTMSEALRTLARARAHVAGGQPFSVFARNNRVWGPQEALMQRALPNFDDGRLARMLQRCGDVDRISKGLPVANRDADAWLELAAIATEVAQTAAGTRAVRA